jgi:microcystin-dependent protein
MAWHEGKPEYRSSPNSKEVRENFAYLKNHPALPPVGSIIAYSPGYFTNGSNAGFTHQMVSANTVAAVNALLNSSGWYVCDGAALNDADSGIFNGVGRYLPNLTDERFLMGDTVAGGIGGANTMAHTHTTGDHALTIDEMPAHFHYVSDFTLDGTTPASPATGSLKLVDVVSDGMDFPRATSTRGGSDPHNHGATGAASNAENRPSYLSCFYIMRVK